ncbi:MAG: bifunctional hydroxymethylpyrimidine kinase/phosphomethylpyrimidine kinase [Blastochloris sp.]|nr:bifunctional hydroxymethylpyrimidine kinase/phosphomethylpyrimidine kinase [Blastochloris sp.]
MSVKRHIPVVLSIAGSDNSGGAGIQADLKTFTTLKVYGTTALTCVVAEHPGKVKSISPVPVQAVREQVELVFEAFPVAAVKTGMLYSAEIIEVVARCLKSRKARRPFALVVDPVMVATSGALLLQEDALEVLQKKLLPLADVVTPNLDEAAVLLGHPLTTLAEAQEAAVFAQQIWRVPFLIKGGHLQLKQATDFLFDGNTMHSFQAATVPGVKTHGTGCTYAAAIAAELARGRNLSQAVASAKRFITQAIRQHFRLGKYQPLNHLVRP